MKDIFILTMAFSLFACSSDTENKGITEISELYGCTVDYSIGTSVSISDSRKKYFELTMSGGENIDLLKPEIVGSGSAIVFYKNLTTEEKANYTHINTIVEQQSDSRNATSEFEYEVGQLDLVLDKMKILDRTVAHFESRDYSEIINLFDPSVLEDLDRETFLLQLDSVDINFGEISGHHIFGFEFYQINHQGKLLDVLDLYGLLTGSIKNLNLQVTLAQDPKNRNLLGIH